MRTEKTKKFHIVVVGPDDLIYASLFRKATERRANELAWEACDRVRPAGGMAFTFYPIDSREREDVVYPKRHHSTSRERRRRFRAYMRGEL